MSKYVKRARLLLGGLALGWIPLFALGKSLQADNAVSVDFSGAWEMDHRLSDDINRKLQSLARELQRRAERQQGQAGQDGRSGPAVNIGGSGHNSRPSIIGLAQMADLVTRSQVLEVEQSRTDIVVKREDTFALACDFHGGEAEDKENPLGREICGWDEHQLVFRLYLPEGLTIQHRLTLGHDGQKLNVATTVVSDRVSIPFTLNRVYTRFKPGSSGIRCETTITRGKVCTTVAS